MGEVNGHLFRLSRNCSTYPCDATFELKEGIFKIHTIIEQLDIFFSYSHEC